MVELSEVAKRRPEKESRLKEVKIFAGGTEAGVSLEGGILNYWEVQGRDALYRSRQILTGAGERKVRGGAPPLFPRPGPTYPSDLFPALSQHGFARDLSWGMGPRLGGNKIALELHANKGTRDVYPHDFGIAAQITVEEGGILKYQVEIANNGDRSDMPCVFGWHPYFPVPLKELENIRANLPGFEADLNKLKKSIDFDWQEEVEVEIPGQGKYIMRSSEEFKKLIVWTDGETDRSVEVEPGDEQGYICFEPWTSGAFTIHNSNKRITLPPGESISLSAEIQFQPA